MSAGFDSKRLDRITATLAENHVDTGAIPGALTLIWRRGQIAHLGLAGVIDRERGTAMRRDAIFRIYSMTKPLTSAAVMMLLEDGKVALDDPLHRYFPGFDKAGPRAMTVLDLLRHTSGLTYGFHNRTPLDAAYRAQGIGEANTPGGLTAMMAALEKLPLEFPPGETWNYSVSTDVLGALVEKISGITFGDFLRTRILTPLGMTDTDFFVPPAKRDRFASCYQAQGGKLVLQDDGQASTFAKPPLLESGGGGLCGTADDYLRFCRMILDGGALDGSRILSPKSVALMTMNHLPGGRDMTQMMPITGMFDESGYSGVGFGLGFQVMQSPARAALPGTVGEVAWGGAASTYFFIDPKEDMCVVFMTQVLGAPDRIRLRRQLRCLVYGAMTESFA